MSNFGYNTITASKTNSIGQTANHTLTWDSTNNRWANWERYLGHNGTRWEIRYTFNGANFLNSYTENTSSSTDPTSLDWTNNWTVSSPDAGAQGDPHIKPLFGGKYTI